MHLHWSKRWGSVPTCTTDDDDVNEVVDCKTSGRLLGQAKSHALFINKQPHLPSHAVKYCLRRHFFMWVISLFYTSTYKNVLLERFHSFWQHVFNFLHRWFHYFTLDLLNIYLWNVSVYVDSMFQCLFYLHTVSVFEISSLLIVRIFVILQMKSLEFSRFLPILFRHNLQEISLIRSKLNCWNTLMGEMNLDVQKR